ncbi:Uncharacterized protein C31G5.21 [Tolypocladium ophioglossoides CBS 100239]|uniref:Uncharacterized protein C31G5.21 n=1 Tax=Tolypocladium ophioglossoides (strain CBS 100239) TaxID=1163406 RepID=A0A0L0NID7_TOLOC|nr:Uncharacterized protein C31G5.21 [Tolypocladium ophioglossoides CBS 100239]
MPSDDYAAVGGGALRIKGAKVQKKKKKKDKSALEKNLSAGDNAVVNEDTAEKRAKGAEQDDRDDDEASVVPKTESERRYEEVKRKRLLEIQASGARPELLKTHKERVEELNTYLSKLSEHHDMPKIGPG